MSLLDAIGPWPVSYPRKEEVSMGERNWYQRYRIARDYAGEQAAAYERGGGISPIGAT